MEIQCFDINFAWHEMVKTLSALRDVYFDIIAL
jgi:hypothetical protein